MPLPAQGPGERLIGVSIPVAQPYADQLQAARRSFGDPLADAIAPHITLVPPTVVQEAQLPAIYEHLAARAAEHQSFELLLRGTGTFRPVSAVVFVQVAAGIPGCERLQAAVKSGPLEQRSRFRFHPHITIAHELPDDALDRAFDELATFQAGFTVTHFALYEFITGAWSLAARFPLARPAG